ncbi:CLUMA_CG011979, isoform A [Clunio marinus]|uniref:CLUMA_CG011979, isoform A n=1 Tax=Clunio marinus TaxID=568069 RepID=A0A1J1IE80_9DIPT|nr:CLUMA_CG011979, isoform A [Clunio marinus]
MLEIISTFFSHHFLSESINFNHHSVIEPKIIHGRDKRALENTLEKNGLHATHIHLIYEHNNKDVILDLHLNDNLIPVEHFISYQQPNGDKAIKNFTKTEIDLCNYQGKIRHNQHSTVAISTCNGIRGVVFDGYDTYYIENDSNGSDRKHFLIQHSDLKNDHKCGYEGGINRTHDVTLHDTTEFNRIMRYKRMADGSQSQIRGPYNANKGSSYVELVLVVDNKVFKSLDKNFTKVHQHCKDIANIINALYNPLNIFVALLGVVIWSEQNLADLSSDGDKTLRSFLNYRKKYLVKEHPNDNAQLLTGEVFEGGVVGKALKGPICTFEFSGGVSMDHSKIVAIVATTIAHEMGHNFGMEHDTDDCTCPDDRCIMSSSSSSVAPTHWSSCSIDQLNLAFHHGMDYCLKNKPTKIFESPICGNGFVESGEECDCGLPQFCNNSCCNPYTCMLYSNATCATGSCCDLTTCKPHTAGTICREAFGECDLPEYCTGDHEFCPNDVFKRDTEKCEDAFCYQGSCRSHKHQCKVLWGPSGASSDQCYEKNTNGSRHGNCGYDRLKQEYIPCKHDDALCGMLQCRHLNERLEFGMESVAILSHSFKNYRGSIVPCRTAIVDLGLQTVDPGLTPDGAECGDNKMCVKQKCLSIEALKLNGKVLDCPDCNGNGVCNSKGHCHCFDGWAPPFCSGPGFGGSVDSGPASDPDSGRLFNKLMYIFFIGVVPCCTLFALFIYYWRQNNFQLKRKSPSLPRPNIKHHITKGSGSPQSPTFAPSSPNTPDDISSSLLRPTTDVENNYIFGKFKGFTLKPLPNANKVASKTPKVAYVHPVTKNDADLHIVPVREAPPPPVPKHGINATIEKFNHINTSTNPPALPPLNKGSTARPIISNPILEASTCDAKEVPAVVKYPTIRPAPTPPKVDQLKSAFDDNVVPEVLINPTSTNVEKKPKDGTLSRIQSFLKKDSNSKVEKVHKQLKAIDKDKLKDLQISSPILINQVPLNDENEDEKKAKIKRAQSMRDPPSPPVSKPLNSFGSMRQQRPKSIVDRPTLPPPPRPPAPPVKLAPLASPIKSPNEYDDCECRENGTPDDIYSVIDEPPKSPPKVTTQQGSIESMGLLSEIVNEIENRNFDSKYIASTLKRNKKKLDETSSAYANVSKSVDADDATDAMSTTSSGYMRPIGAPIARIPPSQSANKIPSSASSNSTSSFKTAKGSSGSSVTSPEVKNIKFEGPMKKSNSDLGKKSSPENEGGYKTPTNKPLNDDKKSSEIGPRRPSLKKTVTPPSITLSKKAVASSDRKRSPSPTKVSKVPSKPKTTQKPAVAKTSLTSSTKTPSTKTSTSISNGSVKTPQIATETTKKTLNAVAKKKSNVAALQQKFESSNS